MIRRLVILSLSLFALSSCQLFDKIFKGDVVARVGKSVIYESEIKGLVPQGSSPEDSVRIVEQYLYSWATKILLLDMAESQLSKEDKNVQNEINEYRTSLLVYKYEKLFVEQRLDTLITESECKRYYDEHKESFTLPFSLIKCRYIKIRVDSPNYKIIKSLYNSKKIEDIDKLDQLCHDSADNFTDFGANWVPLTTIAKEFDMDIASCELELKNKNHIEKEYMGFSYLVSVYEKVAPSEVTPYLFNLENIKESILSKRKQELLINLERNLLRDALNNNKLVIYSKNEKD